MNWRSKLPYSPTPVLNLGKKPGTKTEEGHRSEEQGLRSKKLHRYMEQGLRQMRLGSQRGNREMVGCKIVLPSTPPNGLYQGNISQVMVQHGAPPGAGGALGKAGPETLQTG